MKEKIQEIENLKVKNLLIEFVKCLEKENISSHDREILQELKLPVDLISTRSNSIDNNFHENLTIWQNIFDKELSIDKKLTLGHVKNIVLAFITSAKPPIELQGDISKIPLPLKQSELNIYLKDDNFKEQLNTLAENNISAFELLSNIIGNNDFQKGIEHNYFYGFNLSETQNLFEQANEF